MSEKAMERMLLRWFDAWLENDASAIDEVFSDGIVYSECWGPVYRGIEQVKRWFADWNEKGRVLEWTIQEIYTCGDTLIAGWFFRCEYEENEASFDGVTIAKADRTGRIVSLREFQSKAEHEFPYEK